MRSIWEGAGLDALPAMVWKALADAVGDPGNAFRMSSLASIAEQGPQVRLVVLREVDVGARTLVCFTDRRSPKCEQISADPRVSWLFHDAGAGVQIRAWGRAVLERESERASASWSATPAAARVNYASTVPPGTAIDAPLGARGNLDRGRDHFTLVSCTVEEMDWLRIGEEGHLRAGMTWDGSLWRSRWVAP